MFIFFLCVPYDFERNSTKEQKGLQKHHSKRSFLACLAHTVLHHLLENSSAWGNTDI